MKNNTYARINVLIVTYKQAEVIGRNIESALRQREYGLNQIIVCDDCSPDNNWEVIESYMEKYPDIVKGYRNEPNLGIYGNSNRVATELRGDADLYLWVEGDDAICDGYFKALQEFINTNQINLYTNFGIFSNWQTVSPNGVISVNRENKNILLHHSPFSLYLHGLVSWRGSVFSRNVIEYFKPINTNNGLGLAELLFDSQWFQFVEKRYYLPVVGTSYYTQYGISTTLGKESDWQKEDMKNKWSYLLSHFDLCWKDRMWAMHRVKRAMYMIKPSVLDFFSSLFYFCLGAYPQNANSPKRIKKLIMPYFSKLKH